MADVRDMNTTKASDLQTWIPEVGPKKKKKRKLTKPKKVKKTKSSIKQKKGK